MRTIALNAAVVLFSVLAFAQTGGQATVIGGYASNWVMAPGAYAMPNPPLVRTPEVSLDTVQGLSVGASNATTGNVAGAVSATVSLLPETGPFAVPSWYEPAYSPAAQIGFQPPAPQMSEPAPQASDIAGFSHGRIDLGIAQFQASEGVAELMAQEGLKPQKAARVYTNDDVARLDAETDQNSGVVKYNGKTERLEQSR